LVKKRKCLNQRRKLNLTLTVDYTIKGWSGKQVCYVGVILSFGVVNHILFPFPLDLLVCMFPLAFFSPFLKRKTSFFVGCFVVSLNLFIQFFRDLLPTYMILTAGYPLCFFDWWNSVFPYFFEVTIFSLAFAGLICFYVLLFYFCKYVISKFNLRKRYALDF
jgi:hypothetical protein